MEKRSRRRTRDLVTQPASQGLSENEIGCARISMMARSTNAPGKGRIQMRKTNPLHLLAFGLQRPVHTVGSAVLLVPTHCASSQARDLGTIGHKLFFVIYGSVRLVSAGKHSAPWQP